MTVLAVHKKLLPLDASQLPQALKAVQVAEPVLSLAVTAARGDYELQQWSDLPSQAPHDLMCKLAIKSWRDSGSLQIVAAGVPLRPAIEHLLKRPTPAQRTVARAWLDTGTPLLLHLLPYRSFTDISEVRWLTSPRETRFISACQRGQSAALLGRAMPQMKRLAQELASHLSAHSHIIELACLPDGQIKLVEVNPALQPLGIKALFAA